MIKTGSHDLNKFLKGFDNEVVCIYGEPATGKTTIALQAAIDLAARGGKVVFLDTEKGFSVERFRQLAGFNYIDIIDKILIWRVENFDDQCKKVNMLPNFHNIGLVVVDSLGFYYRKVLKENVYSTNKNMDWQLKVLSELSKNFPVILTNQVYKNIDNNEITPVGGEMIKKKCHKLIHLEREPRKFVVKKPEGGEFLFKILDEGLFSS